MKRFLIYTTTVLIPVIVFIGILEVLVRQVPNTYKYKYDWMQNNAEDVEVLILGGSHMFYGIRPDYFDKKTFNLANVSQGARLDLYLLKKWSDKYKRLKMVLVPISFSTWFGKGLENGIESYRCRYYKIYMDCDLYSDFSLYNFALYDFGTAKKNLLEKKKEIGCDQYGWGTAYKLKNKDLIAWDNGEEADAAVKRHTAKDWESIGRNTEIIKEIADFCKNRNIRLVLITTPCWHSYYSQLDKKQLDKMYELTHALQEEYNLQYFDYLKDERFDADDFYDSNHLSDIGAEKFTKILKNDLGL